MKQILIICTLFLFISCETPVQFEKAGGTIIRCKFINLETHNETPEYIQSVLTRRVNRTNVICKVNYNENDSIFEIQVPFFGSDVDLFLTHGQMNICKVISIEESNRIHSHPLIDSIINIYHTPTTFLTNSILLANVPLQDKEQIDELLTKIKLGYKLPKETRFIWSTPLDSNQKNIELHMVLNSVYNVDISRMLISSSVDKVPQYKGTYELSIKLDEEGAEKFLNLTTKNVNKPLAIILDSLLLSEPIVTSPIAGGRMSISGLDANRATIISAILNSGIINSDLQILERAEVQGARK